MKLLIASFLIFATDLSYAVTGSGGISESENKHNHIAATGQLITYQPGSFFITNACSGVFVSPTIFLTAAHCYRENSCVSTEVRNSATFNYSFDDSRTGSIARIKNAIDSKKCLIVKAVRQHPLHTINQDTGISFHDLSVFEIVNSEDAVKNFVPVSLSESKINDPIIYVGYGESDYGSDTKVLGTNKIAEVSLQKGLISYSALSKNYPYVKDVAGNSAAGAGDSGGPVFNAKGSAVVGLIKGGGDFKRFLKKKMKISLSEDLHDVSSAEFLMVLKEQGKDIRFEEDINP